MDENFGKWLYKRTEPGLWTVGFYDPNGKWHPESDHKTPQDAADQVHYLNGSKGARSEPQRVIVHVIMDLDGNSIELPCGCDLVWTGNATRWWPRVMCPKHTDTTILRKEAQLARK